MSRQDDAAIDAAILNAEDAIVRGQLRRAIAHLEAHFENQIALAGPQAGRAVLEKVYLVCGDRRVKAVNVAVERRRS